MRDHHSTELNLVEHGPEIRYLAISRHFLGAEWTAGIIPINGYMVLVFSTAAGKKTIVTF